MPRKRLEIMALGWWDGGFLDGVLLDRLRRLLIVSVCAYINWIFEAILTGSGTYGGGWCVAWTAGAGSEILGARRRRLLGFGGSITRGFFRMVKNGKDCN